MDPFQVIAWDPGGSSGWAWFYYGSSSNYDFASDTITWENHHTAIRTRIESLSHKQEIPLTVVTESFEFRQSPDSANQRKGLELVSREYIGVMKLVCQDLCVPLVQQSPSDIEHYGKPNTANKFMNYEKLRRLGQLHEPLYENRHRNDAMQHLVYYLAAKKNVEEIKVRLKPRR